MTARQSRSVLLGILLIIAAVPLLAFALTPSQVFDRVKGSVVVVRALDIQRKPISQGSGVMLPSGQVATNCHVVKDGVRFQLGRAKRFVVAKLRASDEKKDLCLLEATGLSAEPAVLGKAAALTVGEAVYAVGSPQGLELSLSNGIVSQLRGGPPPIIQTTAAISPGSSGGGLFDAEGRLVGITTFYVEGGQSLNFAVPVEWLAEVKPGQRMAVRKRSQGEWIAYARELEKEKDWEGALDWCGQWTEAEPGNSLPWRCLGNAYSALKEYDEAINAYREVVRLRPNYAEAWARLGWVYDDVKRYDEAISAYREAVRIKPDYVLAWDSLGFAFYRVKRFDEAINAFRETVRIQPDHAEAWHRVGDAYIRVERFNDAIEAFDQALRIKPDYAEAWHRLGFAYARVKRNDEAINAFREAVRLRPDYAEAWHRLGWAYGGIKRYDDAINAFREAVRLRPDFVDSWFGLASAYAMSGDRPAALEATKALRRYDPARADRVIEQMMSK